MLVLSEKQVSHAALVLWQQVAVIRSLAFSSSARELCQSVVRYADAQVLLFPGAPLSCVVSGGFAWRWRGLRVRGEEKRVS
jgi:hypothetical protein